MQKRLKSIFRVLLALFIFLILAGFWAILTMGPILTGYGGKAMCSCIYVGNRDVESVLGNELGSFPLNLGKYEWHAEDSTVTGSVFGLSKSVAFYRKGLGCTLARGEKVEIICSQLPGLDIIRPVVSDTIEWPLGSRVSARSENGIQTEKLETVLQNAFAEPDPDHPQNTRAVIVVQNGKIIAEQYGQGFDKTSMQLGWSMTKSIINALIGILVHRNKLNIYKPAPVAEWEDENDPRHGITTDMLLRMSSGLQWEEEYAKASTATNMLYKEVDMGRYAALQPLETEPDSFWEYSSGTTNILSRMVRQTVGEQDYFLFPYQALFNKLSIRSAIMEPDVSGTYVGSSYMWATARDWARLGLLYLNDGVWQGERILPEGWVEYSATPTSGAPIGEYGAQFWLNAGENGNPENRRLKDCPTDLYMMDGYEGQRVFMIPSYDAVIVRLGQNKSGNFDFNAFVSGVLGCLGERKDKKVNNLGT
jgi:CubicO group peptidase (beta-lactamase class C family)